MALIEYVKSLRTTTAAAGAAVTEADAAPARVARQENR
jgi:hypothetical protein